jgi:glycosyltransferase involved in cell wall biosynthesis
MRVLHIVTAFPRDPTDLVTHWLVELLKHLRARGVDVEVFTSSYKGAGDHTHAGIPVRRFRYFFRRWENLTHEEAAPDRLRRSVLYRFIVVFYVLAGTLAAWRLCRRERFDVVHVHWPFPLALFGLAARLASGAPVVTTFYGAELRWITSPLPLVRRFLAWAARRSARVIAISSHTAEEVRRIAPVPVDVIPYGIGIEASPNAAPRAARDPVFTILFVGRLVQRKGVVYLIRALRRVRPGNARLVIVGDGPERIRLEQVAREEGVLDRVEFWGRVSHATLREAYLRANLFVLPSIVDSRGDTEGLGVVLLEAMSYRVPVIASDVGGITDIVDDGRTGLLVPPSDVESLATAIQRVAQDPVRAAALAEAGYRHMRERFSWDAISARWENVYSSVMRAVPTRAGSDHAAR